MTNNLFPCPVNLITQNSKSTNDLKSDAGLLDGSGPLGTGQEVKRPKPVAR